VTELEESPTEAVDYDITPLLQPLQVRGLRLRNRFVMPGMQRYWCADGAPDERLREYYRRRVLGGVSLVISESCAVDHPSATKNPTFARISPDTREAWRACVAGVHEAGGAMFLQLWHQGAVNYGGDADSNPAFVALSPSGLSHPGESFGRAATEAELDSLKRAFVQGALDAQEIGTGPDFVISVRISQWKESDYDAKIVEEPAELGRLIPMLRSAGADIFHASTRRFWMPEWEGSDLGLAGWVKSFTDAPVIAVGSVGLDIDVMASLDGQEGNPTGASRIAELVRRFQRGDFDLVSVGRSQIGDPKWVAKVADHRIPDIRPFRAGDPWLSHDTVTT
jgi:2,4-dienoyl-CoA reductase-like NADH-dependent reductase (Old Yellow Enzyme family)